MAGISFSGISHASKLRLTGNNYQDNHAPDDPPILPDQLCPKCNGEGYLIFRVYPWDGCSYDEKPCDLCNPKNDEFDYEYLGGKDAR